MRSVFLASFTFFHFGKRGKDDAMLLCIRFCESLLLSLALQTVSRPGLDTQIHP
jgi:hypothetical protein